MPIPLQPADLHLPRGVDWPKLYTVALYALKNPHWRHHARWPADLKKVVTGTPALQDELKAANLNDLDDFEVAYCVAWAQMALEHLNDRELSEELSKLTGAGGPGG